VLLLWCKVEQEYFTIQVKSLFHVHNNVYDHLNLRNYTKKPLAEVGTALDFCHEPEHWSSLRVMGPNRSELSEDLHNM
jgi:hypothetical protein